MANDATVKAVCKASRLVDLLAEAGAPLSLGELATATGWPKGTVHGLLAALVQSGWVEQAADRKYRLGVRMFICGSRVSSGWEILGVSRPFMRQLAQITQMAVYMATLEGDAALIMDTLDASSAMHQLIRPGSLLPLHATAAGKVLLACSDTLCPETYAQTHGLPPHAPHTLTDADALKRECGLVAKEGFARTRDEYHPGLQEIAAPIWDEGKRARYALCIGDLNRRTPREEWLRLQALITSAANTISLRMRAVD